MLHGWKKEALDAVIKTVKPGKLNLSENDNFNFILLFKDNSCNLNYSNQQPLTEKKGYCCVDY